MTSTNAPRILIIGAGSRGHSYANAITAHSAGRIVGIAEPVSYKRQEFVRLYEVEDDSLVFSSWSELVALGAEEVGKKVDGVCICTLDETHLEILRALRPFNLHILCEKPLATTLDDCRAIYNSVISGGTKPIVFAIGHVLRYSPHNMLLYQLLVTEGVLGEIININHTEPVGYWHFAHSYVRGNWRSGAPSLLTKCCHDIDLLLWVTSPHTPSTVSSHGSLVHFRRSQKPVAARAAKNCLSCPVEPSCIYSAKKIYVEHNLHSQQNKGWPNKIVAPEIEDAADVATAEELLLSRLREDGDEERPYYGRCVYEAGNNVVDNQVVVLSWDDDVECTPTPRHGAKTATLTMIAHTEKICERFTKVYGTKGELTADSNTIKIYDFASGETRVYNPEQHLSSGHGGGDIGLSVAFVDAIAAVKDGVDVDEAQRTHIRCTPEEAVRSHEVVFWAEQARVERRVIGWNEWRN